MSGTDQEGWTVRGASPRDFRTIGHILWRAFDRKIAPFVGSDPVEGEELLADLFAAGGLAPESIRVACSGGGGDPVGVCMLRLPGAPYAAALPIARVAFRRFGLWRGLWAFVGLCFFDERIRSDTAMVSLLAVAQEARGRGAGSALLQAAEAEARARGLARLALDVIENNPARNLYLRHGFVTVRTHRLSPPMARFFGFAAYDHMEKRLQ